MKFPHSSFKRSSWKRLALNALPEAWQKGGKACESISEEIARRSEPAAVANSSHFLGLLSLMILRDGDKNRSEVSDPLAGVVRACLFDLLPGL